MGYSDLFNAVDKFRASQDVQPDDEPEPAPRERGKPLSEYAREGIRSVRCEHCGKPLKYGTRPCVQIDDRDALPVYLCRYCKSGHEHKYEQDSISDTDSVKTEGRPPKRTCKAIIIRNEKGKVRDVLLGCGQTTTEWSEQGTRTIYHKENCAAYRHLLQNGLPNDHQSLEGT